MYHYRHPRQTKGIFRQLSEQKNIQKFLFILRDHHEETYKHSLRVAKLSIDLALEHRFSMRVVKTIGHAALLHDFGKTRIDGKILSKCGKLTREEIKLMSRHPKLGLEELGKFSPLRVIKIVSSHHGYSPDDPLIQIVIAADMYDALSFPRAYKDAFPLEKVKGIMMKEFIGKPILIKQLSERPMKKGRSA